METPSSRDFLRLGQSFPHGNRSNLSNATLIVVDKTRSGIRPRACVVWRLMYTALLLCLHLCLWVCIFSRLRDTIYPRRTCFENTAPPNLSFPQELLATTKPPRA